MKIKDQLISILINNYNNEKFIKRSIKSCLDQTYKNIEIIVYDDNSNDNSCKIINEFQDKRIKRVFNKKKFSRFPAINQLNAIFHSFKISKGNLIFLLDGDDFYIKDKIKRIKKIYDKNSDIDCIQDNPIFFYPQKNKYIKNKLKKKFFIFHTWPYFNPTSTMSFRKNIFKTIIKEIFFSRKKYGKMFFDARAIIYLYFFKKKPFLLDKYLTVYTQNEYGDTLVNYDSKNMYWWQRREEYHEFVKKIFIKNKKKHIKLFDYFLTKIINFL